VEREHADVKASVVVSFVSRGVRALVPYVFVPLCLLASVLAAAPWLRSFPSSLAAAPIYGAAVLSVLVPLVVVRFQPRRLWLGLLVDLVVFAVYTLVVVLREPLGFGDLVHGLIRGPSEILTFALPLVSPRSLMVAPVALVWLAGAAAGECVARRWYTLLPYFGFLVAFGLAYAGTQRAVGTDLAGPRSEEILLAAALLATLLLMRAAQAWVRQDESSESSEPDGVLPLRGLLTGAVTTVVIAVVAAFVVQTDAFPDQPATPQRVPSVDQSRPLAPLAFVSGLRSTANTGRPLFSVTTDRPSSGYFALANVDFYDGAGWSFDRTFRPSGGVLPADTDPALRTGSELMQRYHIVAGKLAYAPWLPFVYRAQSVTGIGVNIDPASGMIVPAHPLAANTSYTVVSTPPGKTFETLKTKAATPDTATPTINTQLPGSVRTTLDQVVQALSQETGTPATPALPFLQAVQRDLQRNYSLSTAAGAAAPTPTSVHSPRDVTVRRLRPAATHARPAPRRSTPSARSSSTAPRTTPKPTPTPSTSQTPPGAVAGGTAFADVLASILGPTRNGTPEQFATLLALMARDLGVPARVVTGFRVEPADGGAVLAAGSHNVTTADAWTWVEIPVNGAGWVVLDGSPARFANANTPKESGAAPPSTSALPSKNPLITQASSGNAVAPKSTVPHTGSAPTDALIIAIVAAVLFLLAVIVAILLSRKRLRAARRRRSPDPRLRLIGAWRESLDVLAEAGLPDMTSMTSAEIAELTTEQFGDETGSQTAALGTAANSVAYSSATPVADADADAAWANYRSLRRRVHQQLGVRGRIAAGMRYHRPRRIDGPVSPSSWMSAAAAQTAAARRSRRDRRSYRGRRRSH
jgi:hypothetical protein